MERTGHANNWRTTLTASIGLATATALVASLDDAPTPPWIGTLYDRTAYPDPTAAWEAGKLERVLVTAHGTSSVSITRAQYGTSAVEFANGTTLANFKVAEEEEAILDAIDELESDVATLQTDGPQGGTTGQVWTRQEDGSGAYETPDPGEELPQALGMTDTPTFGGVNINAVNGDVVCANLRTSDIPTSPELNVMSGLLLWLKPDNIPGPVHGNPISAWPNSWGEEVTTALGGTSAPVYESGAINGRPAVYFPGVGTCRLDFTPRTDIRTVFWVLKRDADDGGLTRNLILADDTYPDFLSGYDRQIWHNNDGSVLVRGGTTKVNGSTVDPLTELIPTDWARLFVQTTGNCRASCFARDRLDGSSTLLFKGWLAELLVYNCVLSGDDYLAVEEYLTRKYFSEPGTADIVRWRDADGVTLGSVDHEGVIHAPEPVAEADDDSVPPTSWVRTLLSGLSSVYQAASSILTSLAGLVLAPDKYLGTNGTGDGFELKDIPAETHGIPAGGDVGQTLVKTSGDDYAADWDDIPPAANGVPPGGDLGQTLVKSSGDDYDTEWATPSGGTGTAVCARVRRTTDQAIATDGNWHDIDFAGMSCDYNNGLTFVAGTTPFTIVTAGVYRWLAATQYADAGNTRGLQIKVGSTVVGADYDDAGRRCILRAGAEVYCGVGDVISIQALKGGGDGNCKAYDNYTTVLAGHMVGAVGAPNVILQPPVETRTASVITCSATVPINDSIPQQSAGTEILTRPITPTNAAANLLVEINVCCIAAASDDIVQVAIYRDAGADAIEAGWGPQNNASWKQPQRCCLSVIVAAGSTSETTFKVRVGATGGNTYINADSAGNRYYGGKMTSWIRVTELSAP